MSAHVWPTPRTADKGPSAKHLRRWQPGLRCHICAELIQSWQRFNDDHIIPMAKGGSRGRKNKAAAHVVCNTVKGHRYPFSLKTVAERERIRKHLPDRMWLRLSRVWAGEAD